LGHINRSINFEKDVFEKMEELRGTNTQFRSKFINNVLREKLGLPQKGAKKMKGKSRLGNGLLGIEHLSPGKTTITNQD
jgi:metal-responsive CopG/Arc/MetJ family transcriptional regulator